jgi:ABC-type antimicrobial peptide transport system permease subunit
MIVSALRHMVLPVLTLAVAPTTEVIRLMRLSTIEVFDQNYVKAAATRGLSRLTILRRTSCTTRCRRLFRVWATVFHHADAGDDHRDGL